MFYIILPGLDLLWHIVRVKAAKCWTNKLFTIKTDLVYSLYTVYPLDVCSRQIFREKNLKHIFFILSCCCNTPWLINRTANKYSLSNVQDQCRNAYMSSHTVSFICPVLTKTGSRQLVQNVLKMSRCFSELNKHVMKLEGPFFHLHCKQSRSWKLKM